ncbi:MAG: hypothetical protein ACPGID_07625 [Rubricella sp.]
MTLTCSDIRLDRGTLHATLAGVEGALPPVIELVLRNATLARMEPERLPGGLFGLSVAVPADVLSSGVQTLILRVEGDGQVLASLPVMAGDALDFDVLAEIDLLRAELDMVKGALRRVLGTG